MYPSAGHKDYTAVVAALEIDEETDFEDNSVVVDSVGIVGTVLGVEGVAGESMKSLQG